MRRLLYLVSVSLVAMLVLAPVAGAQQTVTVSMEDNFFEPANITVEPGTTVTWVQNGSNAHTTTSYDGLWDSGLIQPGGGSFSFTFNDPGTYDYFCIPHEDLGMVGSVTVSSGTATMQETTMQETTMQETTMQETTEPLPASGGPGFLIPVALSILACGALGLTVLRRTS